MTKNYAAKDAPVDEYQFINSSYKPHQKQKAKINIKVSKIKCDYGPQNMARRVSKPLSARDLGD